MQLLFVPVECGFKTDADRSAVPSAPVLPVEPVKLTDSVEGERSDPEGPVLSPQDKIRRSTIVILILNKVFILLFLCLGYVFPFMYRNNCSEA